MARTVLERGIPALSAAPFGIKSRAESKPSAPPHFSASLTFQLRVLFDILNMPEITESTSGPESLKLHNIWADPTDDDISFALQQPSESNVQTRAHLVQRLDTKIDFIRGGRSAATRHNLFPPPAVLEAIGGSIENLTLRGATGNPRNIILWFDKAYCQIQLYTHVLPLICNLDDFYSVLCKLPKEFRYKIGVAFELGRYIVVFTTLDLLIGVHWAVHITDLPTDHIDVYKTPEQFIACLLHWMQRRREGETTGMKLRKQAVATLIRRECHVFAGVGVYTVGEVFHLAGLSLFMTESELFTDESRVGRLLGAMYTWAHQAHTVHTAFVCSKVRGWKICPTFEDKQEWYKFTNVQCKERVDCSARRHRLYEEFKHGATVERLKHSQLHDVFEPMDIITAFSDMPSLLEVVFGPELSHAFRHELEASMHKPTQVCNEELKDIIERKFIPFFRAGAYETLTLPSNALRARWVPTRLYKIDGKFAWTILPLAQCQIPEPKVDKSAVEQTSTLDQFRESSKAVELDSESESDEEEYAGDDEDKDEDDVPDPDEPKKKKKETQAQQKTSLKRKGKAPSTGKKTKKLISIQKYGQGRRSTIVSCDESLRLKKTHKKFSRNSLVHNTGPLDFTGTAHRIARTGVKNNDDPIVLLLPGDYRAGQRYGDRLLKQLFSNGRKLNRSGIIFKSVEDFKNKLHDAQHSPIFLEADAYLSKIMKERGIFNWISSIQAIRLGDAEESEGDLEDPAVDVDDSEEEEDSDSDDDDDLLKVLIDGEIAETSRVMDGNASDNDTAPPLLAFATENLNDDIEIKTAPDGRQIKKLKNRSQLALMARETSFLRARPAKKKKDGALKRRRSMSADEQAVLEGQAFGLLKEEACAVVGGLRQR
ncbi:hypothetical protein SCHPADRAFT_893578 [Schizopora paradoxa]|uniref:Uncharacterized protein n=1 Tax=Schizopora paradoxa TaxID=27342 RepID=A0A0H2RVF6_9AGAM|nr:hypothetical protein SCHPADRAFT_893578 [Schizopora paradoxa]